MLRLILKHICDFLSVGDHFNIEIFQLIWLTNQLHFFRVVQTLTDSNFRIDLYWLQQFYTTYF